MKIEQKWLLAEEITMLDAASLMVGLDHSASVRRNVNPISKSYEDDYREIYAPHEILLGDQTDRHYEAVNEQLNFLDRALKRGHFHAIRNSGGTVRELILSKADWLKWICQTGRYPRLVSAFQQQGDDGDEINKVSEGARQNTDAPAAESGSTNRVITIPLHQHGETWSELELQALLAEYRKGATQAVLAEKYGLTPQRISALLKQAKGQTGGLPGISNPMSGWGGGK